MSISLILDALPFELNTLISLSAILPSSWASLCFLIYSTMFIALVGSYFDSSSAVIPLGLCDGCSALEILNDLVGSNVDSFWIEAPSSVICS